MEVTNRGCARGRFTESGREVKRRTGNEDTQEEERSVEAVGEG